MTSRSVEQDNSLQYSNSGVPAPDGDLSFMEVESWLNQNIESMRTKESANYYERLLTLPVEWFEDKKETEDKVESKTKKFHHQLKQFIHEEGMISDIRMPYDAESEHVLKDSFLGQRGFLLSLPREWLDNDKGNELKRHIWYNYSAPGSSPLKIRDFFEYCFLLRNQSIKPLELGRIPLQAIEMFSHFKRATGSQWCVRRLIPWRFIWPKAFRDPGANFCKLNLWHADLNGADLRGIKLSGDFIRTDFSQADLRQADFAGVRFDGKTSFLGADLSEATFTDISFGISFEVDRDLFSASAKGIDNDKLVNDHKQKIESLKVLLKALKPIELPETNGLLRTTSILELYSKLTRYITSREERKGLRFFQSGSTCHPQKLGFILRVGHILAESLSSSHWSLKERLDLLRKKLEILEQKVKNNHGDILRSRSFGDDEYSLKYHFNSFREEIQTMRNKCPLSDDNVDRPGSRL